MPKGTLLFVFGILLGMLVGGGWMYIACAIWFQKWKRSKLTLLQRTGPDRSRISDLRSAHRALISGSENSPRRAGDSNGTKSHCSTATSRTATSLFPRAFPHGFFRPGISQRTEEPRKPRWGVLERTLSRNGLLTTMSLTVG